MLKRAHELCTIAPDQRLSLIAGEFGYGTLLQAEMNKKAEELKKEVENIRSTTHDIEGSESMYYPVITIKDSPKDKAHSTHHPHV